MKKKMALLKYNIENMELINIEIRKLSRHTTIGNHKTTKMYKRSFNFQVHVLKRPLTMVLIIISTYNFGSSQSSFCL